MSSKGYIAIFESAVDKTALLECVRIWLERFENMEQICPGPRSGNITIPIRSADDIIWEKNPQFRVLMDQDFTWIYINLGRRFIETSGLPYENNVLPLEALLDLPNLKEVVSQQDERRLSELEAQGIID